MALIIEGQTTCRICSKPISELGKTIAFPAFVVNEKDELFFFSDTAFHKVCFEQHPLRNVVKERFASWSKQTGPGNRICVVCDREVLHPDDYLLIHHLTSELSDPLYPYSFTHLHVSCLRDWKPRPAVVSELRRLKASGSWEGNYLDSLISTLSFREGT